LLNRKVLAQLIFYDSTVFKTLLNLLHIYPYRALV
jgi:hypothetical protein